MTVQRNQRHVGPGVPCGNVSVVGDYPPPHPKVTRQPPPLLTRVVPLAFPSPNAAPSPYPTVTTSTPPAPLLPIRPVPRPFLPPNATPSPYPTVTTSTPPAPLIPLAPLPSGEQPGNEMCAEIAPIPIIPKHIAVLFFALFAPFAMFRAPILQRRRME